METGLYSSVYGYRDMQGPGLWIKGLTQGRLCISLFRFAMLVIYNLQHTVNTINPACTYVTYTLGTMAYSSILSTCASFIFDTLPRITTSAIVKLCPVYFQYIGRADIIRYTFFTSAVK